MQKCQAEKKNLAVGDNGVSFTPVRLTLGLQDHYSCYVLYMLSAVWNYLFIMIVTFMLFGLIATALSCAIVN